jgi:tight adherence protein C
MNSTIFTPANFQWILALFTLGIGLSVALVMWLLSKALAAVPQENRQYKDRPPLGFRLAWWPIQWASHYLNGILPRKMHLRLLTQLRQGGMEYTISPAQFVGGRIVCAVLVALVFLWAINSFDVGRGPKSIPFGMGAYIQAVLIGALCGWIYPIVWIKERVNARRRALLRALPFFLDIITLCVEAGLNFQGAMVQAVDKGPDGAFKDEMQRVLRDIRAGRSRADSLRAMAERLNEPSIGNFVSAVIQAESMGMNLGPVLRAQADQRRSERFLRAEKLAMEAPVKMLFPLIAFIFPCTFIVLFFPIVMKFLQSGI